MKQRVMTDKHIPIGGVSNRLQEAWSLIQQKKINLNGCFYISSNAGGFIEVILFID